MTELLFELLDLSNGVLVACAAKGQGERPEGQFEEPAPFFARDVVLELWRGLSDQLNLALFNPSRR